MWVLYLAAGLDNPPRQKVLPRGTGPEVRDAVGEHLRINAIFLR